MFSPPIVDTGIFPCNRLFSIGPLSYEHSSMHHRPIWVNKVNTCKPQTIQPEIYISYHKNIQKDPWMYKKKLTIFIKELH